MTGRIGALACCLLLLGAPHAMGASERWPSYATALEAMRERASHAPDTRTLEAAAAAAVRKALATAALPPQAVEAGDPRAVLEALPAQSEWKAERLERLALEALVAASDDPAARLLPPLDEASGPSAAAYGGIGIRFVSTPVTTIDALTPDGPAKAAGLASGDQILAVDGTPIDTLSAEAIAGLIRGAPGTPVRLTISRAGAPRRDVTVVRQLLGTASGAAPPLPNGRLVVAPAEAGVLYLKLGHLDEGDYQDPMRFLTASDQAARSVILDLRGCRGGLVEQVPGLVTLLGGHGELFALRDKHGRVRSVIAEPAVRSRQAPDLAVLIDAETGPGAALLASALRTTRHAVLVGEAAPAPGEVQTSVLLPNRMRLVLTTHQVARPGGLQPDLAAPQTPEDAPTWASLVTPVKRSELVFDLSIDGALEALRQQREARRRTK